MMHSAKHDGHLKKVRHVLKSGGYATGKQNHSVKATAKAEADKEIHKHEEALHGGKLTKLKTGGVAEGDKSHPRMDKCKRGGKGKHHTNINVIIPQKQGAPAMPMQGAPPPMAAAPAVPPRPPMPPMAGNAPPPGSPGMMRPMKKGGKVMHEEHGSGSGLGRLDKIKAYGEKPKKKGGGKIGVDHGKETVDKFDVRHSKHIKNLELT